jgi:hypothetical protein
VRLSIFIKTLIFLIILLFVDYQSLAQSQGAPESMNYQAIIRNGSGDIVASQSVGIRIDILQGSATGTSVYQETFTTTTNAYGSIAIQIGTGTVVSGTFNTIDWGANSYYVETAVDISGGTNFTTISTTQFMSVPYALYAKNAGLDSAAIQAMIDASSAGGSLSFEGYQQVSMNFTQTSYSASNVYHQFISDELNFNKDGILFIKVRSKSQNDAILQAHLFVSDSPNIDITNLSDAVLTFQDGSADTGSDYETFTIPIIKNKYFKISIFNTDFINTSAQYLEINSSSSSSSSSGSNANTFNYLSDGF